MTAQSDVRRETPAECALRTLESLRSTIPFDAAALLVLDPVTRLFSTGAVDGMPQATCHPFFTFELSEHPRAFRRMALDRSGPSTVVAAEAPEDQLVREVLAPHGYGAELRAVFPTGQAVWGGVSLVRATGAAPFSGREIERLGGVGDEVGQELRAAVVASLSEPALDNAPAPGLLVLEGGAVVESSPHVPDLLRELGHGQPDEYRHIDHLRALCAGPVPFTTVLRTSEGWLTAHGTRLGADRVAVTLSAAGPDHLLGARVLAAGLSAREVEVTRLICRGLTDREIARDLDVSEHTAHDHVRSVRRKLGVRSRSEVSAAIFAERYFDRFLATAAIVHSD